MKNVARPPTSTTDLTRMLYRPCGVQLETSDFTNPSFSQILFTNLINFSSYAALSFVITTYYMYLNITIREWDRAHTCLTRHGPSEQSEKNRPGFRDPACLFFFAPQSGCAHLVEEVRHCLPHAAGPIMQILDGAAHVFADDPGLLCGCTDCADGVRHTMGAAGRL